MALPRLRPRRAERVDAETVHDVTSPPATQEVPALPEPAEAPPANTALAETTSSPDLARAAADGPLVASLAIDSGLYGVLGVPPSASDAEIQTSYRQQASRLLDNGTSADIAGLRRLNSAYEVLGTPVRRAEYDQARLLPPTAFLQPPAGVQQAARQSPPVTRRRRPREVAAAREAGLPEVLVVVLVVAFSALAAWLLIPHISPNLSVLNGLSGVLPGNGAAARRVIDATVTPAPARTPGAAAAPGSPEADADPGLAAHFDGSTATVSTASPAVNSPETVLLKLVRDGQPASNVEVWTTVQYRTTQERWPATGTVRTDSTGTAPITFNVGAATPGYPVDVHVFAQVDDQQLSWSTTFTPH